MFQAALVWIRSNSDQHFSLENLAYRRLSVWQSSDRHLNEIERFIGLEVFVEAGLRVFAVRDSAPVLRSEGGEREGHHGDAGRQRGEVQECNLKLKIVKVVLHSILVFLSVIQGFCSFRQLDFEQSLFEQFHSNKVSKYYN